MKYIITTIIISIMAIIVFGQAFDNKQNYIRIQITANSNNQTDIDMCYQIKDIVGEYLRPFESVMTDSKSVINILNDNNQNITNLINLYLTENNCNYKAIVKVNNEFCPSRTYGDLTLQADYYDLLKISLGQANGQTWWCVIYPQLCFNNQINLEYKSIINQLLNR